MRTVLTVVTAGPMSDQTLSAVTDRTDAANTVRLGPGAADFIMDAPPTPQTREWLAQALSADLAVQPEEGRRKKILIADMDSTIIEQECLDELADVVGVGPQIAAITDRAMRGELDFEDALRERLSLLAGLSAAACDEVIDHRLTLSPGAESVVRTMRAYGAETALVSGGFTQFVEVIADRCGFTQFFANRLEIDAAGNLTGRPVPPVLGRSAKAEALARLCREAGVEEGDALAVGDGANDLAMIERAGLGVAYRAKPAVAAAADATVDHSDLRALLYFQGYRDAQIVP